MIVEVKGLLFVEVQLNQGHPVVLKSWHFAVVPDLRLNVSSIIERLFLGVLPFEGPL